MKGEERVCHVTEADRLGPQGLGISEKCLHVRPLGADFVSNGGLAPVRGGFVRRNPWVSLWFRRGSSASKGIWWMPWH